MNILIGWYHDRGAAFFVFLQINISEFKKVNFNAILLHTYPAIVAATLYMSKIGVVYLWKFLILKSSTWYKNTFKEWWGSRPAAERTQFRPGIHTQVPLSEIILTYHIRILRKSPQHRLSTSYPLHCTASAALIYIYMRNPTLTRMLYLRDRTWLCVYCCCQTPEGVVSSCGKTTPERVGHQDYGHNHPNYYNCQ